MLQLPLFRLHVTSELFDYDYSPQSSLVETRRVWLNVSQEGQSDIEVLREEELINALLVSSKSYKPVVLYQVSDKGQEVLQDLARQEKEAVNNFAHKPDSRELLKTSWEESVFGLSHRLGTNADLLQQIQKMYHTFLQLTFLNVSALVDAQP